MKTLAPIEHFEIGDRVLRISLMPSDRLEMCQLIGQSLRMGLYSADLVPFAVATIVKAMVIDNHPDVRSSDLVAHLQQHHFHQTADELARQLLLSLPAKAMGTA